MITLYTYKDLAKMFGVKISTIRNWKHQGLFKIRGYKRLGKWAKQAWIEEDEVNTLIRKKVIK